MAFNSSSFFEIAPSTINHIWEGNRKVIFIFKTSYTIPDFLSFLDTLRLDSDPQKIQASAKASRLFYTFSGLHFLLTQVYAVATRGLDHSSRIEIEELKRKFESGNDYLIEFIKILRVVEIHYLELILLLAGEEDLINDYVGEVLLNKQMTALEQVVRKDQVTIPYLLTVLESEGLDISIPLIRQMLHNS